MLAVVNRFGQIAKFRVNDPDYSYRNNRFIKTAIRAYYDKRTKENLLSLLDILINCLLDGSEAPTPMADEHNSFETLDVENLHEGDILHFDHMQLRMETLTDPSGSQWFPLYTDREEIEKGETSNIVANVTLENILRSGLVSDRVEGVVINPFGQKITLEKYILEIILNEYDQVIEQKRKEQ
ncbi:MAG: SseB family protein [Erysipelotrichaceae bacterium]|nr:SseB family protein [Erysipelotrichaceae bacterium]